MSGIVRCDQCDNGIEQAWEFCAWCGCSLKNEQAENPDEGGLSPIAVRLLGFDAPCRCGHEDGLHDSNGRCAVFGCECDGFLSPQQGGTANE